MSIKSGILYINVMRAFTYECYIYQIRPKMHHTHMNEVIIFDYAIPLSFLTT